MPAPRKEFEFAEVIIDRLLLESYANEQSAYFVMGEEGSVPSDPRDRLRTKLTWHINHSLSPRQKQVIKYYLSGWREREIARTLGIKQQVVNIYKHRAIKRLQVLLAR